MDKLKILNKIYSYLVKNVGGTQEVTISPSTDPLTVKQATHANLNCNANLQIGNVDVGVGNEIPVVTSIAVPETIGHVSNSTISDTAATQIDATSNECKKCIITASENNTGFIRFGGSTLTTTTGIILYSGESFELEISNTNLIYAIAEVNGEDVSVTYLN